MDIKKETQREITLKAMKERPGDPWPKGDGHVVLGEPGSPRQQKAYHEPGGLFSPSPGSFGVSFWIVDFDGRRICSSEEFAPDDIKQKFSWSREKAPPAILTDTPYYSCSWSLKSDGQWLCELNGKSKPGTRLALVFRSTGPAGAPLESADWDGRCLILNHRWSISFSPGNDIRVLLGDESTSGLGNEQELSTIESSEGWACARIESDCQALSFTIRDSVPLFKSPLSYSAVKSELKMELPSKEFTSSLDAQAAHLMMGFIGRQTCPGEPTNYPLAWERDGAYSVLAMARAGQIKTAMELCIYFAENDFFGGFGAEGDAPGSAINALVETALISGDREFQQRVWPHIKRKAGIIREMHGAREVMRKPWLGPIVPIHKGKDIIPVICGAAMDGLINGTMDNHHPVLYVNAVSCRGLRQAAKLAEILGEEKEFIELSSLAESIRNAWLRNFNRKDLFNERNFITALWPSWTVSPDYIPFREELQRQWERNMGKGDAMERPLWTYFNVAEAHQWLLIGEQERTWATLKYFWANQCSPGLYSYWEGNGAENSFELWAEIRGWLKPKYVTPHYWTAAEMLLLQLDMLAYVDESKNEHELVIGAGIPSGWMSAPMRVEGIHSSLGRVDWYYADGSMQVRVHRGGKCKIRLGTGFSKDTCIVILQP